MGEETMKISGTQRTSIYIHAPRKLVELHVLFVEHQSDTCTAQHGVCSSDEVSTWRKHKHRREPLCAVTSADAPVPITM